MFKNGSSSSSQLRNLSRRTKWINVKDGATSRIKPPEDTLVKVVPICKKIVGVTRLADITYMDKLYIPNYSAILPGTQDKIWVYNGKGPTKAQAKASTLMESIERYCALPNTAKRNFISGSYDHISKKYKVLHPAEVVESLRFEYKNEKDIMAMDFLTGIDLFTNEQILVPAGLALYEYYPKDPTVVVNPFTYTHTNGLASGNVIEEAICHALCEVIERDAASIAELCASAIPYDILRQITNALRSNGYPLPEPLLPSIAEKYIDDSSIFPDVDISELADEYGPVRFLVKRFSKAGIPLAVKDITQEDIGIPTFIASSFEWISSDYAYFVYGYGTHPDTRIALIRAITEISQNRAGDIQGARDDLKKIKYKKESDDLSKRLWQFIPSTYSSNNTDTIKKFYEIKTYVNEDILDDIKFILNRLNQAGIKRAIVIDLTNPDIGIPVVRAIVPGLETFDVSKSIMGRRAKEYFVRMNKEIKTNV